MVANVGAYGYNPFVGTTTNSYADDIMFQQLPQYNPSGAYQYGDPYSAQLQQALANGGLNQPQADTFQKSGGIGFIPGAIATTGAAGAAYYFANPFKDVDGKLQINDKFINNANKEYMKVQYRNARTDTIIDAIEKNKLNESQSYAMKKYLNTGKLSEANKKALAGVFKDKEGKFSQAELDKYINELAEKNKKEIQNAIDKLAKQDLAKLNESLANNTKARELLKTLDRNATKEDIVKLVKENPKAFGITATEPKDIETAVNKLVRDKNRDTLIGEYSKKASKNKKSIKDITKSTKKMIKNGWDKEAKAFSKKTPFLTKALKKFKWQKAGKWGAIVGGCILAYNFLFGGKKS